MLVATPAFADDEAQAKQHFKAAQAAFDLGQFEKALQGYSDAYAAKPLPAFLFNIAQCHKLLGQWERAAFFYRRYASLAPPGTDRAKLDALIAQVEQKQQQAQAEQKAAARASDAAAMRRHTLELERAREATAHAEAEAAARVAEAAKLGAQRPPEVPLYQRWYVWAGAGAAAVVVAGVVTAVAVGSRPRAEVPSYGTVNAR